VWRFGRLRCTTINDMIPVFLCLCEFILVTFHFSFFIFHFPFSFDVLLSLVLSQWC